MAKLMTVLGLMSGTSMDGIDLALIRTDGDNVLERIGYTYTPYSKDVQDTLRSVQGKSIDTDGLVKKAENLVTELHIEAVNAFLETTPVKPELIGFHGQTIFHNPAEGRTWQIGDGEKLAHATGIDVIYDFRSADMVAGGQGAPLIPLYHKALARTCNLAEPACILNLGGVGNLTWINGDTVIACDTGTGNALIDDWMLEKTGIPIDMNGEAALHGSADYERVKEWLKHPYFLANPPKSLDRNTFSACSVAGLSTEDGAATLAAFTAASVLKTLRLMPAMPREIIVAGGGRKNLAIMAMLGSELNPIDADQLGWNGDAMEAEGFAYLAARSLMGLPLSLPTTTGCNRPTTGGKLAKAHPERLIN